MIMDDGFNGRITSSSRVSGSFGGGVAASAYVSSLLLVVKAVVFAVLVFSLMLPSGW